MNFSFLPEYSVARGKSRRRGNLLVATLLFLAIIAIGAGAVWKWQSDRAYQRKWGRIVLPDRTARVLEPLDTASLGKRLQGAKKLRDVDAFVQAANEIGLKKVAAGGYALPAQAGPRELAKAFLAGPTLKKITFPEGWTALRMAQRLKNEGFSGAEAFRARAYPAGKVSPWEGKLFPDTYYLPVKGDAAALMEPMHERFNEVLKGMPRAALPKGESDKRLTEAQVLTLASLVERETSVHSERALIAGVLLHRLQKGMRLQCDASVQYARERAAASGQLESGHKNRLFYKDLKIDSAYNTYRHSGLPPGPICNPGKDSLQAAAAPRTTDKLFYVMSPKLGKHLFARTYAEHLRNIARVKAER